MTQLLQMLIHDALPNLDKQSFARLENSRLQGTQMDLISLLQWPAMAVSVVAAWDVASTRERKRNWGFWLFLVSNALWIIWGLYSRAPALVALQVCLAAMNIRGAMKSAPGSD